MGRMLVDMSRSHITRRRPRTMAYAGWISGGLAAASFVATGGVTTMLARDAAAAAQAKADRTAAAEALTARQDYEAQRAWAAENPVVVEVPREERTVIAPEVLASATAPSASSTKKQPTTTTKKKSAPAPAPTKKKAAPAPKPKPKPKPAPTSGS